jgi:flagellar protein FliO/FliZ
VISIIKDILPLVFTLFAVILILYLSYVFTKFIGKRSIKYGGSSNMKIVDRLSITQDKSIVILKAGGKFYLLAVSPSDIKLITELEEFDENSLAVINDSNIQGNLDFKSILNQIFPTRKK